MAVDRSYEEGLRDGKIERLEETAARHAERMDSHSRRLSKLERAAWIILGIMVAIEALPKAQEALKVLGGG